MQYYKGEEVTHTREGYVSLSATYVPKMPHAGFKPLDAASLGLAIVLIALCALVAYPYVRKAIIAIRS